MMYVLGYINIMCVALIGMLGHNRISYVTTTVNNMSVNLSPKNCFQLNKFSSMFIGTIAKIVSEYDQEEPQSQTADHPVAPRGRAAQPSRDTRKTN